MAVVHIVLFKFKSIVTDAEIREVCDDFLSLKSKCLHPETNEPYVVNSSGGKDHSPENAQHGFTHGFVEEFASKEDRDYYLSKDPEHLAFVEKHKSKLDDVAVIDFSKGVY